MTRFNPTLSALHQGTLIERFNQRYLANFSNCQKSTRRLKVFIRRQRPPPLDDALSFGQRLNDLSSRKDFMNLWTKIKRLWFLLKINWLVIISSWRLFVKIYTLPYIFIYITYINWRKLATLLEPNVDAESAPTWTTWIMKISPFYGQELS